jgi:hypothetical protein
VLWSRQDSRRHTEQLMDELAQSYDHLKLAAGHAAGGAAERVTPPYDRARNMAARRWGSTKSVFAPFYEQMREGAANARMGGHHMHGSETQRRLMQGRLMQGRGAQGRLMQERGAQGRGAQKKNRWPMLVGLLAAGAAVGAAGAVTMRRRRAAAEWDEYEPLGMGADYGTPDVKAAASKKLTEGAATVAGSVSSGAGKLADSLHTRSSRSGGDDMGGADSSMSDLGGDHQAKRNSRPGQSST